MNILPYRIYSVGEKDYGPTVVVIPWRECKGNGEGERGIPAGKAKGQDEGFPRWFRTVR